MCTAPPAQSLCLHSCSPEQAGAALHRLHAVPCSCTAPLSPALLSPALLCDSLLQSHGVVHMLRFERRYLALQRAFQTAFLSRNVTGVWVQKVTEASSEPQRNGFFSSASSSAQASRSFAGTDHGHTSFSHERQYGHKDRQSLALACSQGTHTDQLMLSKSPVIGVLGCPSSAVL